MSSSGPLSHRAPCATRVTCSPCPRRPPAASRLARRPRQPRPVLRRQARGATSPPGWRRHTVHARRERGACGRDARAEVRARPRGDPPVRPASLGGRAASVVLRRQVGTRDAVLLLPAAAKQGTCPLRGQRGGGDGETVDLALLDRPLPEGSSPTASPTGRRPTAVTSTPTTPPRERRASVARAVAATAVRGCVVAPRAPTDTRARTASAPRERRASVARAPPPPPR